MENLSFQYPTWYLLLCFALGLLYALVLYYRDHRFGEQSTRLNIGLGVIRFLLISFLSMLLLSPILKSIEKESKPPIVVLAQDQSESITAKMDEDQLAAYQAEIEALQKSLGANYELHAYNFGKDVKEGIDFDFSAKVSNFSKLFQDLFDLYSNQNVGAIIMASDGIYNEGSNPIYLGDRLAAPVYTIALGDTSLQKDLILKRAFHNKIAYLGDKFSVQLDIAAQNCSSQATTLNIFEVEDGNTKKLQQQTININKNDFFTTVEVILDATKSGVRQYRISLSPVADEASRANNVKDIFVDVLDARQKILILANAPHPDVTALKQTITNNKNYEVETAFISNFSGQVRGYDFVIFHQLPSSTSDISPILSQLQNQTIPSLFIVGAQTNINQFNQIQSLLSIQWDGRNTNEVQSVINPAFNAFTISDELRNKLGRFAPLLAPFGDYGVGANATVLLYQKIGKVDTEYPLLLFGEENNTKMGILCAEGIWKWRLFDFLQHQNHNLFEELVGKSVQYVSLKEDKRRFRVNLNKNVFNENESVIFDAELYNESYELVNDPDVRLSIINSEGKEYTFTFNKTTNAYTLNAGIYPVGNFRFTANTTLNGESLSASGRFSVQPVQLEIYETTADHGLLRQLSEQFGGDLLYPGQVENLPQMLEATETVKPVIYQTSKTRSVINLKWIFALLLGLMTFEWFFRRYFGAY